ncbi:MAG: glycosyltransferase family 4 protein [Solirubrobacteraceae bacterium]
MRVLLLHNRYRAAGGEERAVSDLAALLARRGHTVEVLERSSAALTRARAAGSLVAGGVDADEVAAAVRRLRADVVHAHNLLPLFGWRALAAARAAGARTVLHLHNFRLFCAIAVAHRDGAPCFRCRGANTLPGVRLRCRGRLVEATVYATGLHLQQPHLYAHADRFVVVSRATASRLIELGLPAQPTVAMANFVPRASFAQRTRAQDGEYALVAGRLVAEKGVDTAIAAARGAGVPLVVAGAGPDEPRLRSLAEGADVRFTGHLHPDALADLRAGAAVVLAPSRWEEPCPYAVLDALAAGVPVRVSDRGGLPELVDDSHVLPAADPRAWTTSLAALWRDRTARRVEGELALAHARERFDEGRYHDALMEVYRGGKGP